MHFPVVAIVHICERRGDPAFRHDGVRFAEKGFADHPDGNTSHGGFDRRAQTRATRADDQNVVSEAFVFGHSQQLHGWPTFHHNLANRFRRFQGEICIGLCRPEFRGVTHPNRERRQHERFCSKPLELEIGRGTNAHQFSEIMHEWKLRFARNEPRFQKLLGRLLAVKASRLDGRGRPRDCSLSEASIIPVDEQVQKFIEPSQKRGDGEGEPQNLKRLIVILILGRAHRNNI